MDPITLAVAAAAGYAVGKVISRLRNNNRKSDNSNTSNNKSWENASKFNFTHGNGIHTSDDPFPHLTGKIGNKTAHINYYGQTTLGMYDRSLPGHKLNELIDLSEKYPNVFNQSGLDWENPKFAGKKDNSYTPSTLNLNNNINHFANSYLNEQEDDKYSFPHLDLDKNDTSCDQIQPLKINSILPDPIKPSKESSLTWQANQEHWLGGSIADQKSYFDADVFKDKSPTWKANQEHWLGSSSNSKPSSDWVNTASNECYEGTPVLKPTYDRAYEAKRQMVEWGKDLPMYGSACPGTDQALVPFTGSDPGLPMYGSASPRTNEAPLSFANSDPMRPSALPTALRSSFNPMAPRYLDLK